MGVLSRNLLFMAYVSAAMVPRVTVTLLSECRANMAPLDAQTEGMSKMAYSYFKVLTYLTCSANGCHKPLFSSTAVQHMLL